MKCPVCFGEIPDSANYCKHCGCKIARCPTCGRPITKRVRFCPQDGTRIPEELLEGLPDASDQQVRQNDTATEADRDEVQKPEHEVREHLCSVCGKPCQEGETLCEDCRRRKRIDVFRTNMTEGQGASNQKTAAAPIPPIQQGKCRICGKPCDPGADLCLECTRKEKLFKAREQSKIEAEKQKKTKSSPPWYLFLIVFVIIVGIASIAVFSSHKGKHDTQAKNGNTGTAQLEQTDQTETENEQEAQQTNEDETEQRMGADGLGAVPVATIDALPDVIDGGTWDTSRRVQGVEWNTDTMDTFYICYASYIVSYDSQGNYRTACNDVDGAYLFGIDYYDGKLFSVMRSSSYGKFKLRVYDAETLELLNSVDLAETHKEYASDKEAYGKDLIPSIDGITVAPALNGDGSLKIYVSYNCYRSAKDGIVLNDNQQIFEYDYKKSIKAKKQAVFNRKFYVDLGAAEYGIQTLEYDRSSGNIWCSIRRGDSAYDLYCLDAQSRGDRLSLLFNGEYLGWDCPNAGDGLCSLGNDWFYVLIPDYKGDSTSTEIRKVSLDELESIE